MNTQGCVWLENSSSFSEGLWDISQRVKAKVEEICLLKSVLGSWEMDSKRGRQYQLMLLSRGIISELLYHWLGELVSILFNQSSL